MSSGRWFELLTMYSYSYKTELGRVVLMSQLGTQASELIDSSCEHATALIPRSQHEALALSMEAIFKELCKATS